MEDRPDRRRCARPPPHRAQPDNMTTERNEPLRGKAHWQPARIAEPTPPLSWVMRPGDCERSIAPVDGPAPHTFDGYIPARCTSTRSLLAKPTSTIASIRPAPGRQPLHRLYPRPRTRRQAPDRDLLATARAGSMTLPLTEDGSRPMPWPGVDTDRTGRSPSAEWHPADGSRRPDASMCSFSHLLQRRG